MIPGPSSTDNGLPVLNTGSPMVTPAVHDNTYITSTHKIIALIRKINLAEQIKTFENRRGN